MYRNRYTPIASPTRPVSEGQKNFIRSLLAEREVDAHLRSELFRHAQDGMNNAEAKHWIDLLKTKNFKGGQKTVRRNDAPAELGVYALNNEIFAVREFKNDRGETIRFARRAEFTNADHDIVTLGAPEAHRVDWVKAPGLQFRLASEGRRLSLEDIEKLSVEFEQCFVCGKALKVLESKKAGIGPVCRGKVNGRNATSLPHESELKGYQAQERFDGEDLPGGVVYESARELAQEYLNATASAYDGADLARITRQILEDEEGEATLALREQIYDAQHTR